MPGLRETKPPLDRIKNRGDVVFLPVLKGRNGMCDKCVLASRFTDQALLDGIRGLIERAEVEKAVLHPDQTQ